MAEKLIPENDLENLLVESHAEKTDFQRFIKAFLKADVCVPSASEVNPDSSGLEPLLFDKKGTQMLSVFTSVNRVTLYKDLTPYCLTMKGRELLSRMPPDFGLVLNPGFDKGFDISPAGLKKIRQDFDSDIFVS